MALTLHRNRGAIVPNSRLTFSASGGVEPYVYTVVPGGAGGVIDMNTGRYQAPSYLQLDPRKQIETIRVIDAVSEEAEATVIVGDILSVLVDILQNTFQWSPDRIYVQNQNILERSDERAFIVISEGYSVPFGSSNRGVDAESGLDYSQIIAHRSVINFDIKSYSMEAVYEKERIVMALSSQYSQNAQSALSFKISRLPSANGFVNLSSVTGSAIPHWYRVSMNVLHSKYASRPAEYYDRANAPGIISNP